MPDSQDPKKVSNNDLRGSQFGGGLINADTVNAGRIGDDIYNIHFEQQTATSGNLVQSQNQTERSLCFRDSLEKAYNLQNRKVANIRMALVIETDPTRKFQYEHQLQEEECRLKELDDRLNAIEEQLKSTEDSILYKHEHSPVKAIKTKLVHDEHKFEGKLVLIQVDVYEHSLPKEVCIKLSISFGAPEINIPNFNPLLRLKNKTTDIKYGIKNGELNLDFQNGKMPLNRRENLINENNNWEGMAVGSLPSWQFSIKNESKSENQLEILYGNIKNEVLGILELLDLNVASEINAYFKISINRINIAIIDLDDGTNKKQKETKIGLLLKYLKSELENYVSKVVIQI
ncbi:hypothetical protein [Anabaena sp. CCY 9910]|uniref:hypothetical protein n=1 Tax=Anabaena sp. CCY 9910 TaxID=3103870 RepID=UPI0039DFE22B